MASSLEAKFESMAADITRIRSILTQIVPVIGSCNNQQQPTINLRERLRSIPLLVQGVLSEDPAAQVEATIQFKNLLATGRNPPTDEVIQAGVVPRFVEFLGRQDLPQLQYEAAWILGNIASGTSEHTRVVVHHGAVPKFVKLLMSSPSDDIRKQAARGLGNISADSPRYRDLILGCNVLRPLVHQLNVYRNIDVLRTVTWTLSTFCHGKPPAPFEQVKLLLPVLERLIRLSDEDVLFNVCCALGRLSDGPTNQIQTVTEAGVCPRLVQLLLHPSLKVLLPALRTVGNILHGNEAQIQVVIDNQVLPQFLHLLTKNTSFDIKKEVCRLISKITAGNRNQIQAVIETNFICPLVHLLKHAEPEMRTQALWAITNAILGGSREQIRILANQGCLTPLCDFPISSDPSARILVFEGIEKIIKVGEDDKEAGMNGGVNIYAQEVLECVRQH